MCTMIAEQVKIDGSGKGREGWFELREANVSYDHPFDAPFDHALNIDFVNEAQGPGARVAVELSATAARTHGSERPYDAASSARVNVPPTRRRSSSVTTSTCRPSRSAATGSRV